MPTTDPACGPMNCWLTTEVHKLHRYQQTAQNTPSAHTVMQLSNTTSNWHLFSSPTVHEIPLVCKIINWQSQLWRLLSRPWKQISKVTCSRGHAHPKLTQCHNATLKLNRWNTHKHCGETGKHANKLTTDTEKCVALFGNGSSHIYIAHLSSYRLPSNAKP